MKHIVLLFCILLAGFGAVSFAGAEELAWHDEKEFRWASLNLPRRGKTGFTLLAPEQTGVTFTNSLEEQAGAANRVLYNGSGVAVGDYDNDGLPDIYFCSLNGMNA